MTQVNVDDELYEEASKIGKSDLVEYPTTKNFIDKAIKEKK